MSNSVNIAVTIELKGERMHLTLSLLRIAHCAVLPVFCPMYGTGQISNVLYYLSPKFTNN